MMLNDLVSNEVYPGQKLKIPIPREASKRVINKNLINTTSAPVDAGKNTNNRHYRMGAGDLDDSSSSGQISLNTFVQGVSK